MLQTTQADEDKTLYRLNEKEAGRETAPRIKIMNIKDNRTKKKAIRFSDLLVGDAYIPTCSSDVDYLCIKIDSTHCLYTSITDDVYGWDTDSENSSTEVIPVKVTLVIEN